MGNSLGRPERASEIRQLHFALGAQKNILRLQVELHDVVPKYEELI